MTADVVLRTSSADRHCAIAQITPNSSAVTPRPEQRRLARSVGPDERGHLAGRYIDVDVGDRHYVTEGAADPRRLDASRRFGDAHGREA